MSESEASPSLQPEDASRSPGLDFVNSGAPLSSEPDPLLDGAGFEGWLGRMTPELVSAFPADLPSRRVLLREARLLRDALRRLYHAISSGTMVDPRTVHAIDRVLSAGTTTHRLSSNGEALEVRAVDRVTGPLALLAPLARSALETALTAEPRRLRDCAADDCVHWFVDTSKGGRRKWCSMAGCGNRAKAARYRKRNQGG